MDGGPSRREYLGVVAAIGGAVAGCVGGGGDGNVVDMTDGLRFEPATIAVEVGATVTWENVGRAPHTVTAYAERIPAAAAYFASGGFDTEAGAREAYPAGRIEGGGTYEHPFAVPGTYAYFCVPHERAGMVGTIEVG